MLDWATKKAAEKVNETIVQPLEQTIIRKADPKLEVYSKLGKIIATIVLLALTAKSNDNATHHSEKPSHIVINNYIYERRNTNE